MVERRRCLHDPVTEADALGALRHGREEHLGRARVAVLLEEVVFDLPHVVDAELVRELALFERIADQPSFGVLVPWPRQLVLVEDPELHAGKLSPNSFRRCEVAHTATRQRQNAWQRSHAKTGNGSKPLPTTASASTPSHPCTAVAYNDRKSTVCTRLPWSSSAVSEGGVP